MTTLAVIAIIIAGVILAVLAITLARRASVEREIERERLAGEASAHRDQADTNVARARELGREADAHRAEAKRHAVAADEHTAKAQEHAEKAAELERRIQTAGMAAAFHDEQAAGREQRLGDDGAGETTEGGRLPGGSIA